MRFVKILLALIWTLLVIALGVFVGVTADLCAEAMAFGEIARGLFVPAVVIFYVASVAFGGDIIEWKFSLFQKK